MSHQGAEPSHLRSARSRRAIMIIVVQWRLKLMATSWLKVMRRHKGWTQLETAKKLGVSQPYLSLLEQGRRPLTKRLLSKLPRPFDVPVTELHVEAPRPNVGAQQVAEALGALGYPGFAYLKRGVRWHPVHCEPVLRTVPSSFRARPKTVSRARRARLSVPRLDGDRHSVWPHLLEPPKNQSQCRLCRAERRRRTGERPDLVGQFYGLRPRIRRRRDLQARADRESVQG